MPKDSKVKSQVTQDKIETDEETFIKVAPDQTCTQPLIPTKDPTKEVDFDVTLEKGVIYNPEERVGIYGKTVEIGYGCRINGSIYGRDKVDLSSGAIEDFGGGMVYGNISSLGDVIIEEPDKKMDDYGEGVVNVVGDVAGKNVKINSPTIVKGNILSKQDIEINAETIVQGNIYSKRGKVSVAHTVANSIIAGNYRTESEEEEGGVDERSFGIDLKWDVSILTPLIWLKNKRKDNDVHIERPVRIVGPPCWNCEKAESVLKCMYFSGDDCEKYQRLTSKDKLKRKNGVILSNAWRRVHELPEVFSHSLDTLGGAIDERKNEKKYEDLFKADEYGEYATLEDMATNVEQSIEKTVVEDQTVVEGDLRKKKVEIGEKIEGHKVRGDIVKGDKVKKKTGTEMKDSVALRSDIGGSESEEDDEEDDNL